MSRLPSEPALAHAVPAQQAWRCLGKCKARTPRTTKKATIEASHCTTTGSFQPVPFGNSVALNIGKGGPGTGRTIHATAGQGQHGPVDKGMPGLPSTKG